MKIVVSSVLASASLLTPFFSPLTANAAPPPTAYATMWNRLPQASLPPTPLYQNQLGALKQVHTHSSPTKLTVIVDSKQRLAQLQSYAQTVNTPQSPLFHHFLTPQQVNARFGPTQALINQAKTAIHDAGWKILSQSPFSMKVETGNPKTFKVPVASSLYAVAGLNPVRIQPTGIKHASLLSQDTSAANPSHSVANMATPSSVSGTNFLLSSSQNSVTTAANGDTVHVMSFNPGITHQLPSGLPFNLIISAQSPSGTPLSIQSIRSISDTLNNIGNYGQGQPFKASQGGLWQLELVAFGPTQKTDTVSAQVTLTNGVSTTITFPLPPFTGQATALFPLNGAQISQLLGAQTLYQTALKQTPAPIAIFSLGQAPSISDLSALMNQEGLPMPDLHILYQDGAVPGATDSSTALESNLDVQALSSVAPGTSITDEVYPQNDSNDPLFSFLTSLSQQSTIKIATVSYGFSGESSAVLGTLVDACTAEGITLIFASGDQGAYGGSNGQLGVPTTDIQPGILTVGGLDMAATATFDNSGTMTSLNGPTVLKSWGGDYLRALPSSVLEADLQQNAASSGGFGATAIPSWQQDHLPSGSSGIGVPDISSLAGMPAMQGIIQGQAAQFGGTSLAAPLTAGWLSDLESVNQVQNSGMGNINPMLFQAASTNPSDFLQAQWGSNGYYQVTSSQPGSWNPVTGLGAPNWDQLASLWHPASVTNLSLSSVVTSATVGSKVPFTLTALNKNGNPDPYFTGPISLTSSDPNAVLPSSSQLHFSNGQAIFNVVFEQTGTQSLTATDPLQNLKVTSNTLNITNPLSLNITPSSIAVGQNATMTVNSSVSSSGLQYQFWIKDPATNAWHEEAPYSTNSSLQFAPQVPGQYQVEVFVKGLSSNPQVVNGSFSVSAPKSTPMVSSLSVSAPQIFQNPGANVTFTAKSTVSAGSPLYQFWVHGPDNRWTMVQNYSSNPLLTLKDLHSGSYVVAVYALSKNQYSQNNFTQAYYYTTVLNVGSHVSLSLPGTLTLGHSLTLNASAQSLTNPVYQYWIKSPDGQWSSSGNYGGSTYQFTPSQQGTYTIVVYAKDPYAPATSQFAVTATQSITVD